MIEFFGVEPSYDAAMFSYSFEVRRDGLKLLITIFDFEGAVWISLFRDGLPDALFMVRREFCTHVQIADGQHFRKCFEAGAPKHAVTDMGITPVLARGVRVYLEPQSQVDLIEPPGP